MSSTLKTLILWIIIIILVFLLWSLQSTAPSTSTSSIRISTLVALASLVALSVVSAVRRMATVSVLFFTKSIRSAVRTLHHLRLKARSKAQLTLAEVMLQKQRSIAIRSAAILTFGITVGVIVTPWIIDSLFLLAGAAVLLCVNYFAAAYRIRRGLFGNSEYEIRELLRFIIESKNRDDLDDGSGGQRRLFRDVAKRAADVSIVGTSEAEA